MAGTFDGGKISVKDLFSRFTFNIPAYQRPFVWGADEFDLLFEDIKASTLNKDPSYFLGALVLHTRSFDDITGEGNYDIVDGQQRITTLLILLAVIRDILREMGDTERASQVQKFIYQEADKKMSIPEQVRLIVWPDERAFFKKYVLTFDGTRNLSKDGMSTEAQENMAKAIHIFRDKCDALVTGGQGVQSILDIFVHLRDRCYFLYTRTDDKALALTQFIRLNARGVDLQSSDLLKTENLAEIRDEQQSNSCSQTWIRLENDLGRDRMELLLGFIRDIQLKQKARKTLWEEYQLIFSKGLINRGVDFFDTVQGAGDIYNQYVLDPLSIQPSSDIVVKYQNIIGLMRDFIPSADWVPVLIRFIERFGPNFPALLTFTERLERRYVVDWVCGLTPTQRLTAMYGLLRLIDGSDTADSVINGPEFDVTKSQDLFLSVVDAVDFYYRPFCKYILLRLDLNMRASSNLVQVYGGQVTVEHVLPRNPDRNSPWVQAFNDKDRENWTNRLGNLVLLSRRTNTQAGRKPFADKKQTYFAKSMQDFHLTNDIAQYQDWTPAEVKARHQRLLTMLKRLWF